MKKYFSLVLGYSLSNTPDSINLLQYTDDTGVIADSAVGCQHLLTMTELPTSADHDRAVANMVRHEGKGAKVLLPRIHGSTSSTLNPNLKLAGETLPVMGNNTFKFLGLPIQVPRNQNAARAALKESLDRMLQAVVQCPLTRKQKLKLYKLGICPRLSWPLTIQEFPITWLERNLEAAATCYLKKWCGLAKSANPNILFLPKESGGLGLASLYNRLSCSCPQIPPSEE